MPIAIIPTVSWLLLLSSSPIARRAIPPCRAYVKGRIFPAFPQILLAHVKPAFERFLPEYGVFAETVLHREDIRACSGDGGMRRFFHQLACHAYRIAKPSKPHYRAGRENTCGSSSAIITPISSASSAGLPFLSNFADFKTPCYENFHVPATK
jgi:hypothetical protein